jgi:hypothetical protein
LVPIPNINAKLLRNWFVSLVASLKKNFCNSLSPNSRHIFESPFGRAVVYVTVLNAFLASGWGGAIMGVSGICQGYVREHEAQGMKDKEESERYRDE